MAFVFIVSFFSFCLKTSLAFNCAFEDTSNISKCSYLRPSIDAIRTLVIYCTGDTSQGELPDYWATVWDTSSITLYPNFFKDNSNSKYILYCDPKVDTVDIEPAPFRHPSCDPNEVLCTGGGADFADGIFPMVDSVVLKNLSPTFTIVTIDLQVHITTLQDMLDSFFVRDKLRRYILHS